MSSERLQKILSQAGLGSRREMERWIESGWVQVNGNPVKLGDSAGPLDKITVKGKLIANPLKDIQATRILLYHKPVGEVSSRNDPKFEKTVFDNLPHLKQGRWVQVGRLDLNTSGLLLFTNNGDLANQLMHPKYELEREYAVRVHGQVSPEILFNLKKGVVLDDGPAKFTRVQFQGGEAANSWYHVTLNEGRNREVRRLWESQGLEVSRLIRIRYGTLFMPKFLGRGETYELNPKELSEFLASLPKGSDTSSMASDNSTKGSDTSSRRSDTSSRGGDSASRRSTTSSRDGDSSSRRSTTSSRDGDSSSRRSTTTSRDGDPSSRRSTTSSRDGDSSSRRSDTSSRGGDSASRRSTTSSRDGDSSSRRSTTSSRGGDSSSRHSDTSSRGGDSTSRRSTTTSRDGDSSSRRSTTSSRGGDSASRRSTSSRGSK